MVSAFVIKINIFHLFGLIGFQSKGHRSPNKKRFSPGGITTATTGPSLAEPFGPNQRRSLPPTKPTPDFMAPGYQATRNPILQLLPLRQQLTDPWHLRNPSLSSHCSLEFGRIRSLFGQRPHSFQLFGGKLRLLLPPGLEREPPQLLAVRKKNKGECQFPDRSL